MAVVFACGPGEALSHRSAAALWGFGTVHRDYIDVSVRRASESRLRGVRCHRRPSLPPRSDHHALGHPPYPASFRPSSISYP
jgi:hypothetical protein